MDYVDIILLILGLLVVLQLLGLYAVDTKIDKVGRRWFILKEYVEKLNRDVYGEGRYIDDGLVDTVRDLRLDQIQLRKTFKPLVSLIRDTYKKDIELVLSTDHGITEGFEVDLIDNELKVIIKGGGTLSSELHEVLTRAEELKRLQSKLCKPKCKAKKGK